jgi:hypothetical protein
MPVIFFGQELAMVCIMMSTSKFSNYRASKIRFTHMNWKIKMRNKAGRVARLPA